MIAAITSNQILAFCAVATLCAGIGIGIGRKWSGTKKQRQTAEDDAKKRRGADEKADAARDAIIQECMWALNGKPADQWNPQGVPGITERVKSLGDDLRVLENNTAATFKALLDRAERTDDSTRDATALAAKAVLDTASKASLEKNEAAATAAADLIAAAAAAKAVLALVLEKPPRTRTRKVA